MQHDSVMNMLRKYRSFSHAKSENETARLKTASPNPDTTPALAYHNIHQQGKNMARLPL